jgi:hypothetical protein
MTAEELRLGKLAPLHLAIPGLAAIELTVAEADRATGASPSCSVPGSPAESASDHARSRRILLDRQDLE